MTRRARFMMACSAALVVGSLAAGCQILGVMAHAMPDPTIAARYKGLKNQRVAVMVWTDQAMAIDWPMLQLDLTRSIQGRLQELASKDHAAELAGTKFAAAESSIRYQRDHPEAEGQAIADVAPHLDVDRLIYIEVEEFGTRPEESMDLYRGSITANLKVLEISANRAHQAFEYPQIHVVWPPKSPEEGVSGLGDIRTREQTIAAFTKSVVDQFVAHTEEREKD